MNIEGKHWQSIWLEEGGRSVGVIDQTQLPYSFKICSLKTLDEVAEAISSMIVRGAPLIGVAGAYGLMLSLFEDPTDRAIEVAAKKLIGTRPTAINLKWSINRVLKKIYALPLKERAKAARFEAQLIANEDIEMCQLIGQKGLDILRKLLIERPSNLKDNPINILTHCNAGWLATVDWGTALAPIYKAHRLGMNIHVWVDETRPRNQGTNLTSFELTCEGVPNTLIVDNAGGYLMQKGLVDVVLVGSDRITKNGDICNKIGTYLKALAARDNQIPFYVAAPSSTIDWTLRDGLLGVPIEERSSSEITHINGVLHNSKIANLRICNTNVNTFNPAFDITPANLISGIITERGMVTPNEYGLKQTYPEV